MIQKLAAFALIATIFTACQSNEMNGPNVVKVLRHEAEPIAIGEVPGGAVRAGHLDKREDRIVWVFEIERPDERNFTEVAVDARTGAVVSKRVVTPTEETRPALDTDDIQSR
jgi:Peptidase propeptide and YPEB domain